MNNEYDTLSEGINDPGIFKAVFLAGGPGSGKSFIVGRTALSSLGLKLVNSDDAFERMLMKAGMTPTPKNIFSDKGQEIRQKAKNVTGIKQKGYMDGRLGLVIDGTGKDFAKIQKQANALKKLGYDVAMIFVNTDLETAKKRNKMRARSLPTAAVTGMWKDVQKNLGKFQNFFNRGSEMIIVDNSEESDFEGAILGAYRKMSAWVKRPPTSPAAKRWIDSQKKQRQIKEDLRKWFGKGKKGDWVRVGTDGEIKGACAREPGEGKPKCMPRSKAHSMDKDDRATSARRKRRKDPVADRKGKGGKPIMVKTDVKEGKKHSWKSEGHYTATGEEWTGPQHAHNGQIFAGAEHNDDSQRLYHYKELPKAAQDKVEKKHEVGEACWSGWKQKGMKKKGNRIVPNCVKEDGTIMYEKVKDMSMGDVIKDFRQSDAPQFRGKSKQKRTQMAIAAKLQSQEESYVLPKLKPAKSPQQKKMIKGREKKKGFDAKINPVTKEIKTKSDIAEAPRWMLDPLAKTVYRMQYKLAAQKLKKMMDDEKKKKGKILPHSPEYYAMQVSKSLPNSKVDTRTLAKMVAEEAKYEWGTPEATAYYKKMTPGEKKKTEDIKPIKTPISVKEDCGCDDEDEDLSQYLTKIETTGLKQEDIDELNREIDNLDFDDLVDMGLYDDDEIEEVEVYDDIQVTEALSIQGRMKRRFNARRNKQKLKVARQRRGRMASDPGRIKRKAARGARNMMKKKLARGRDMGQMPPAEKARIETLMKRFEPITTKLAQRMVVTVRKAEVNRLKSAANRKPQKAKKFKIKKGGTASKYKAKKFKVKKK